MWSMLKINDPVTGLSGKVGTGRCWTDQNFSPSGSPKLAGDGLISEPDSAHWIFLKGQYWPLLAILAPRYHRILDYVAYISISGELLVEEVGQVSLPEGNNGTPSAFTSQGSLLCLLQGWISTCHPFALDECFYFLNSPWETFRENLIDRRAARVGGRSPSPSRHRGGQLLHFPAWNTPNSSYINFFQLWTHFTIVTIIQVAPTRASLLALPGREERRYLDCCILSHTPAVRYLWVSIIIVFIIVIILHHHHFHYFHRPWLLHLEDRPARLSHIWIFIKPAHEARGPEGPAHWER